jgi:hypothetical protein
VTRAIRQRRRPEVHHHRTLTHQRITGGML